MTAGQGYIEAAAIRREASRLFNRVWELLDTRGRSSEQDAEMIRAAIASRTLWGLVGGPREACIGEWQTARVYETLREGRLAGPHADAAVTLAEREELGEFLVASAHEAAARAATVAGNAEDFAEHHAASAEAGERITDPEERAIWRSDFDSLRPPA